jgi:hypothetical protein
LVLADLVDQGWAINPSPPVIELMPPGLRAIGEAAHEAKARIRRALVVGQKRHCANQVFPVFCEGWKKLR